MIDICSEGLAEYRGIYKQISERTIRDDIRVMRSDILGFEAPIFFEDRKYFYEDTGYSIFRITLKDQDLLKQIFNLLLFERENIKNEKLDLVLQRLSILTGLKVPPGKKEKEKTEVLESPKVILPKEDTLREMEELDLSARSVREESLLLNEGLFRSRAIELDQDVFHIEDPVSEIQWGEILKSL